MVTNSREALRARCEAWLERHSGHTTFGHGLHENETQYGITMVELALFLAAERASECEDCAEMEWNWTGTRLELYDAMQARAAGWRKEQ